MPFQKYLGTAEVEALAARIHEGQCQANGTPYLLHPQAVASAASEIMRDFLHENPGFSLDGIAGEHLVEICIQSGLLHDTLEDQPDRISREELSRLGVHPMVVETVEILTKKKGMPYREAIQSAKSHPIARICKMADLSHNRQTSRVAALLQKRKLAQVLRMQSRYLLSYLYLADAIDEKTFVSEMA